MDPATLAASVVAVLAPYLAKAGEAASTKVGDEAAEGAGKLFGWLKSKLQGRGKEALDDLAAAPSNEDNQADLRKQILKSLSERPELQERLAVLLAKAPAPEVIMSQTVSGDSAIGNQIHGSSNQVSIGHATGESFSRRARD